MGRARILLFSPEGGCYLISTVFLSSYRNTSGSLGEREMLWEHEPQASVSTAFSSSSKLSIKQLDCELEISIA